MHVVIVGASEGAGDSAAVHLRAWGHVVEFAYEAETALAMAAQCQPDVLLLDVSEQRVVEAYALAMRFRDLPALKISFTSCYNAALVGAMNQAGVPFHLLSPVEPWVLRALLRLKGCRADWSLELPDGNDK